MELSNIFQSDKKPLMFIVFGFVMIAVSGLFLAMGYFVMDMTQTALESVDCDLTGNVFGETCQDLFAMVVYPFLNAKVVLVYLSYFFIFILVAGMLLVGYNSGTKPWMLGVLLLVEIALTYGSFYIANIYRSLLENEVIRTALIQFSAYNKIMLFFPWFVFVVSLFSLTIGIVNWQRSKVNTPTGELDY